MYKMNSLVPKDLTFIIIIMIMIVMMMMMMMMIADKGR